MNITLALCAVLCFAAGVVAWEHSKLFALVAFALSVLASAQAMNHRGGR